MNVKDDKKSRKNQFNERLLHDDDDDE